MTIFLFLISSLLVNWHADYNIDFGTTKNTQNWIVVVDGVMGGLSTGKIDWTDNSISFSGTVSLENNGGFASIRSPYQSFDLSPFNTVAIRFRAKGQSFAITLAKDSRYYMPYYRKNIYPESEDWQVLEFPISDFGVYRLGRRSEGEITAEGLSQVIRLGVITNDKQPGAFEIEIDYN